MASGFCSESQTDARPGIRPLPRPISRGAGAGWHSPASWAFSQVRAALLQLLPVCSRGVRHLWVAFQFLLTNPQDGREARRVHVPGPRAKALLCWSDPTLKDFCFFPSKRTFSASKAGLPSECGELLTLSFMGVLVLVFGGPSLCPMFPSQFLPRGY